MKTFTIFLSDLFAKNKTKSLVFCSLLFILLTINGICKANSSTDDNFYKNIEPNITSISLPYVVRILDVSEKNDNKYNICNREILNKQILELNTQRISLFNFILINQKTILLFGKITSFFGNRLNPILKRKSLHKGIDLYGRKNEDILSPIDGIVVFSGWKNGYGNTIIISDGNVEVLLAHNSKNLIKLGDRVEQCEKIAEVGHSGNSTGFHSHVEIYMKGQLINPLNISENEVKSKIIKQIVSI